MLKVLRNNCGFTSIILLFLLFTYNVIVKGQSHRLFKTDHLRNVNATNGKNDAEIKLSSFWSAGYLHKA